MSDFWAGVLILFVIFLICRELVCWYWKQNEQVKLLKEIRDALVGKEPGVVENFKAGMNSKRCKHCGAENGKSNAACLECGNEF